MFDARIVYARVHIVKPAGVPKAIDSELVDVKLPATETGSIQINLTKCTCAYKMERKYDNSPENHVEKE